MNTFQSISFLSPEEIATREMPEIAYTKLPHLESLFKDRELRLRYLAEGHAMRDFLLFMADVSSAQHQALNDSEFSLIQTQATLMPSLEHLQACAQKGLPPLRFEAIELGVAWISDLKYLLSDLLEHINADIPAVTVLNDLGRMSAEDLQLQVQKLLTGSMSELNMAIAPLIAAALQVYWVRLASITARLYPSQPFPQVANATLCPCCGSKPVSSINTLGTDVGTSRYLHCSLCQTQWYMTRIKCTHCESTKGIAYHSLTNGEGEAELPNSIDGTGVAVETCDECMHYLKIVNMSKNPLVEPVADDLATLTLDILIAEEGYEPAGIDLMLLFGPGLQDEDLNLNMPSDSAPTSGLH